MAVEMSPATQSPPRPIVEPGIYYDMPSADYFAAEGVSNSVLRSFEISALQAWYENINPYRPERIATPSMILGTALHAAVLEPDTFTDRYNWMPTPEDFPGCLDTVKQIKEWLDEHGVPYKNADTKPALITAALRFDKTVRILEHEIKQHAAANHGRILLSKVEWERTYGMAQALRREHALKSLLANGRKEVSIFHRDALTGLMLKCRIDWLAPGTILDLKTFSTQGLPVNVAVNRSIQSGGYIRQARFYTQMHESSGLGPCEWINAFVCSEAPYEVRLRSLGPDGDDGPTRYWEAAGRRIRASLDRYAKYLEIFGDSPWVYHQQIFPVRDSQVKVWEWEDEE